MANQYRPTTLTVWEYLESKSMPEPNSGCQVWLGAADRDGYGSAFWQGRFFKAHRLAWIVAHGPIPDGLLVCHKCDVTSCINCAHLWLGTNAENAADRNAKGRQSKGDRHAKTFRGNPTWRGNLVRGSRHAKAVLTESQVRAIRQDDRSQRRIAADYGIDPSSVGLIKRRKNWAHLT